MRLVNLWKEKDAHGGRVLPASLHASVWTEGWEVFCGLGHSGGRSRFEMSRLETFLSFLSMFRSDPSPAMFALQTKPENSQTKNRKQEI